MRQEKNAGTHLIGENNNMSNHRRGFVPEDEKDFSDTSIVLLQKAQQELLYLVERGYPIKNASTFVGNHHMLSERQRLAIVRASGSSQDLTLRKKKELTVENLGQRVVIDGFNTIITLEVALSQGTLLSCMDGAIRDLAGLRGTYRLIDQTDQAICLLGDQLKELNLSEVIIYLDAPVSNTGRLKSRIFELLGSYPFHLKVELINQVDVLLQNEEQVVTSDSIIMNKCKSWFNLNRVILEHRNVNYVDLSNGNSLRN